MNNVLEVNRDNLNQDVQYHKLNPEVLSRKKIIEKARRHQEAKEALFKIQAYLQN